MNPCRTAEIDPREPLLRAIQREIDERRGLLRQAEGMLAALAPSRHCHAEQVVRLESEVSLQRRELRQVARELSRLGLSADAEDPHMLVALASAPGREESTLGESGFRRWIGNASR
jgi:hypothetical protein